jgi:hypothetical protein
MEGSVEWYDVNYGLHVYNAGDSFIENNKSHYIRNVSTRADLSHGHIHPA